MDRNTVNPVERLNFTVALRKESVDRNNVCYNIIVKRKGSLSARRAWIEIFVPFDVIRPAIVALRKESVDRNVDPDNDTLTDDVALRKESVDRNLAVWAIEHTYSVALRKESVDRNFEQTGEKAYLDNVALRKESVDRNKMFACIGFH